MELCDLWDAEVRTLDGKRLGRVHDVEADGGRIVALACGPGSLIERLTAKSEGRRIPWECVRRIADGKIFVTLKPPKGETASASRSQQGTRRPSGPPSKR